MYHDENHDPQQTCKGIMDSWGVGDRECNNGVVIYFATQSRKIQICTGRGAMYHPNRLTDGRLTKFINAVKPHLKDGDYPAAVHGLISRMRLTIFPEEAPDEESMIRRCLSYWFVTVR